MTVVNQSMGRIIRHHQDFGTIHLLDKRFAWPTIKDQISKWASEEIIEHEHITETDTLSK